MSDYERYNWRDVAIARAHKLYVLTTGDRPLHPQMLTWGTLEEIVAAFKEEIMRHRMAD